MWESIRLIINDKNITKSPGLYPYKAYISNVLTYDPWVKACQLQTQGWVSDTANHMETTGNTGFLQRNLLFREDFDKTKPYRAEGAQFITRIHHDLISCTTGLPPGSKFVFELDRASDKFVILKESTDTEDYKLKLLHIALYVPIAQLSQDVALEIDSILTKSKPVVIQHRSTEIIPLTISKNLQTFHSELLFTEEVPARIVLVVVDQKSKQGTQTSNPFAFRRKWTVPKPKSFTEKVKKPQFQSDLSDRIRLLEDVNRQLLESVKALQESLSKKPDAPSSCGSVTNNLQNITLNDLGANSSSLSDDISLAELRSLRSNRTGSAPSSVLDEEETDVEADTIDVWITKVQLTINGNDIDQIEYVESKGLFKKGFIIIFCKYFKIKGSSTKEKC